MESTSTIEDVELEIIDVNNNNKNNPKQQDITTGDQSFKVLLSEQIQIRTNFDKDNNGKRQNSSIGTMRAVLHILTASLVAFQIGYTIGFSSSASKDFEDDQEELNMNTTMLSWFGSIITASGLLGSLVSVPLMKKLGKFVTIITCNIIFLVGWFLLFTTASYGQLFCGRALTGLAMGIGFAVIPLYIGEMSPPHVRGILGAVFNIVIAAGIPTAYGFGVFINWREMSIFGFAFAAFSLAASFTLPESPYWLAINGKEEKSRKVFGIIENRLDTETLDKIDNRIQELKIMNKEDSGVDIKTINQPFIYKPLLLVLLYCVLQQFTGINAVIYNVHFIFKAAKFYDEDLASILVGLVQFVTMIAACGFMDKAGRRKMLLVSSTGTCLCLFVLGFSLFFVQPSATREEISISSNSSSPDLEEQNTTNSEAGMVSAWISLASLLLYIMFFAIGMGPIPFILIGEMVPRQLNEVAGGLSSVLNNLMSLVVIQSFLSLSAALSLHSVMWFYSACCGLTTFITWKFLPEVKGKTLLEIQDIFRSDRKIVPTNSSEEEL